MKKNILIAIILIILAGSFVYVFPGKLILPQYFSVGPVKIHYYGIIMAAAVLAAYFLARKRAPQYDINPKLADDLIFWLVLGGFAGARLYHVLSSFEYYWQHPVDVIRVWNGGLSIFGAIFGGTITLILYHKSLHLRPNDGQYQAGKPAALNIFDWLAPSVLLGQIVGRFGNLFNYEAFGYPTNLPWKMYIPEVFRPEMYSHFSYFHPVFLYEVLGNCLILFYLLKLHKNHKTGHLFFFYLLLYNVLRFFLEFLRVDSTFVSGLRLNSVMSFVIAAISAIAMFTIKREKNVKVS